MFYGFGMNIQGTFSCSTQTMAALSQSSDRLALSISSNCLAHAQRPRVRHPRGCHLCLYHQCPPSKRTSLKVFEKKPEYQAGYHLS
jgi:hypothetical protein